MTQSLTLTRLRFPVAGTVGWDNAATPDPKEVVSQTADWTYNFDMGENVTFDQVFLGFLSGPITQINISTATSLSGGYVNIGTTADLVVMGPSTARYRHAFLNLAAPVTSRYWAITVLGSSAAPRQIGILGLGKRIQPVWGHDWGSGRFIDDRSEVEALRGGGFGIERGARAPGWEFTVSELDDNELASLWDLVSDVGKSAPVLVAEDPSVAAANLSGALHYGLFDRPEAYTRETPGQNRWSFRVLGWV